MLRYDRRAQAYGDWVAYPAYNTAQHVYYDTPSGQQVYPASAETVYAMTQDAMYPQDGDYYTCAPQTWSQPSCAQAGAYDDANLLWSLMQCTSPGAVPSLSRSDSLGSRTPPTPCTPDFGLRPKLEAPPPAPPPLSVKLEPDDGFVLEPASLLAESYGRDHACLPPNEVPLRATQAPPKMRRMMGVFRLNPFAPAPTESEVDAKPLDQPGKIITFQLENVVSVDGLPQLSMTQEKIEDVGGGDFEVSNQVVPHATTLPCAATDGGWDAGERSTYRSRHPLLCDAQSATPYPSPSLRPKAARTVSRASGRTKRESPHPYRRPATPRLPRTPPCPVAVPPRPRRAPPVDRDALGLLQGAGMNAGYAPSQQLFSAGTSFPNVSRDLKPQDSSSTPIMAPIPRRSWWAAQKPSYCDLYAL
ncbi:hypothetical protein GGG16DRAFT_114669 [Schizophyllum commune]